MLKISGKKIEKPTIFFNFHIAITQTNEERKIFPITNEKILIIETDDKKNVKLNFISPPKIVIIKINLNSPCACKSIIKYCIKAVKIIENPP